MLSLIRISGWFQSALLVGICSSSIPQNLGFLGHIHYWSFIMSQVDHIPMFKYRLPAMSSWYHQESCSGMCLLRYPRRGLCSSSLQPSCCWAWQLQRWVPITGLQLGGPERGDALWTCPSSTLAARLQAALVSLSPFTSNVSLCAYTVLLFPMYKTLKYLGLPKYSCNYFLRAKEIVPKTFLILNLVSFTLGKQLL